MSRFLKGKLWNTAYGHAVLGFFVSAALAGFTSAPYPILGALVVGLGREILQQFNIPKPHEKQIVSTMFSNIAECVLGGTVVEILIAFLK